MFITMKSDRSLGDGRSVQRGDVLELPDAYAYELVWAGHAAPGVRARVAPETLFVGSRNCVRGDLVDLPGAPSDRGRFYPQLAVVPAAAYPLSGPSVGMSYPSGAVAFAPAATAVEIVSLGGRWASQAEADAYDWPESLLRDDLPTRLVAVPSGVILGDGRVTTQSVVVAVPLDEADRLIGDESAEPYEESATVGVRVACDNLLVGTTNYTRGDVVDVPRDAAADVARFEPIDGPLERPVVWAAPSLIAP